MKVSRICSAPSTNKEPHHGCIFRRTPQRRWPHRSPCGTGRPRTAGLRPRPRRARRTAPSAGIPSSGQPAWAGISDGWSRSGRSHNDPRCAVRSATRTRSRCTCRTCCTCCACCTYSGRGSTHDSGGGYSAPARPLCNGSGSTHPGSNPPRVQPHRAGKSACCHRRRSASTRGRWIEPRQRRHLRSAEHGWQGYELPVWYQHADWRSSSAVFHDSVHRQVCHSTRAGTKSRCSHVATQAGSSCCPSHDTGRSR